MYIASSLPLGSVHTSGRTAAEAFCASCIYFIYAQPSLRASPPCRAALKLGVIGGVSFFFSVGDKGSDEMFPSDHEESS